MTLKGGLQLGLAMSDSPGISSSKAAVSDTSFLGMHEPSGIVYPKVVISMQHKLRSAPQLKSFEQESSSLDDKVL